MRRITVKSTSLRQQLFSKTPTDIRLLILVIFISLFGLLMVYNVSQFEAYQSFQDKYYFIKQQSLSCLLGFISLGFFSFLDYRLLKKISLLFFIFSVILLLLVFIPGLGIAAGGAHRWLKMPFFSIQPAEIAKLSTIIFLATLFDKKVNFWPFLIIAGLTITIVGLFQKDLGSAIIFAVTTFGMYYLAGAPYSYIISSLFIGIIGFLGFVLTSSYRRHRVLAFLDPFADPQGFSYHISQILIALGSGGLFGLGIGQSRQKFAYIPEVTTDSIFSIIGEEFGFLGGIVIIMVFAYLIWRGMKITEKVSDRFGKLLAGGLTIWLGSQAILNLGAMVSLVPLTGVPLPFISYGGSALIIDLTAVGILINISKHRD